MELINTKTYEYFHTLLNQTIATTGTTLNFFTANGDSVVSNVGAAGRVPQPFEVGTVEMGITPNETLDSYAKMNAFLKVITFSRLLVRRGTDNVIDFLIGDLFQIGFQAGDFTLNQIAIPTYARKYQVSSERTQLILFPSDTTSFQLFTPQSLDVQIAINASLRLNGINGGIK